MKKTGFAILAVMLSLTFLVTACKKPEAPQPAGTTEQKGALETTAPATTTAAPAAMTAPTPAAPGK